MSVQSICGCEAAFGEPIMHRADDFFGMPQLDYDGWRETLRRDWGWHTPTSIEPRSFAGKLGTRSICGFVGLGLTCNAPGIERTMRDARLDERGHYYAAIQVAGGSTVVQDERALELSTGDVVLIDAAKAVTYAAHDAHQYGQWFCLQLPRRSLASHLGFEPKFGACGRRGTLAGRLLHHLVLETANIEASETAQAGAYMQLAVYGLLGALFAPDDRVLGSRHTEQVFARVCTIIAADLADPDLGPSGVAAKAGISLRYLQKLFTARGTTCTRYIQSLRLDRAARLLERRLALRTRPPLSEIAYACGFQDYTYFARGFRRRFGRAPGGS
jgi:AraC family transcriptional regulator, positive regulator of tynA and feaB